MSLTQDEVLEIMNLINESDYDELNLEMGDLKLTVKKSGGVNSVPAQPSTVPAPIEPPTAAPAPQVVTQETLPNAPTSSTDSNSQLNHTIITRVSSLEMIKSLYLPPIASLPIAFVIFYSKSVVVNMIKAYLTLMVSPLRSISCEKTMNENKIRANSNRFLLKMVNI